MFHATTKHVNIKYHFIQYVLEDKCLQLVKVYMDDKHIDLLTKGLSYEWFAHHRVLMGTSR